MTIQGGDKVAFFSGGYKEDFTLAEGAVFEGTEVLQTTPAVIIATYVVAQSLVTWPSLKTSWPLYISLLPDGSDVKSNAGAIYDTTGALDGRLMLGPTIQHFGLQIKIRSTDYNVGWAKINNIAAALDTVHREVVTINTVDYMLFNISRASAVVYIGREKSTKQRHLFTINLMATIKERV